jgi:hypothetical protein
MPATSSTPKDSAVRVVTAGMVATRAMSSRTHAPRSFDRLAVDPQPAAGVELQAADAEGRGRNVDRGAVDGVIAVRELRLGGVEAGGIRVPEGR